MYERPKSSTYTVNGKSYSYTCGYVNNASDELSSFVTPLGTVTYERDGLKRLKCKRLNTGSRSIENEYEYAANRSKSGYTSQLVSKMQFRAGNARGTYTYSYDASGNITSVGDGNKTLASYEYDGLGRLTRENINGEKTVVYGYDNAGNLTSKKEYAYTTGALGAVTATHSYQYASGSWGDRLTFYNGQCIKYNAAGYPTCYRGKQAIWTDGCLTTLGNTPFEYNDAGIRTAKGSTKYFVKGNLILAEKRGDTVIHYYYDDSSVAGFEYNGQKYVYRKNLQGDIVAILDECGCTRGTYEYDAWGNIIWQGGSELLTINPFRYRGYYYDEETGLYYLNSRYYDPETGRFISPDSVEFLEPGAYNGLNLYAYCGNNPVNYDFYLFALNVKERNKAVLNHNMGGKQRYKVNYSDLSQLMDVGTVAFGVYSSLSTVWLNASYFLANSNIKVFADDLKTMGISVQKGVLKFNQFKWGISALDFAVLGIHVGLDVYDNVQRGMSSRGILTSVGLTIAADVGLLYLNKGLIYGATYIGSLFGPAGAVVGLIIGSIGSVFLDIFLAGWIDDLIDKLAWQE